jgi:hypothetical protein
MIGLFTVIVIIDKIVISQSENPVIVRIKIDVHSTEAKKERKKTHHVGC